MIKAMSVDERVSQVRKALFELQEPSYLTAEQKLAKLAEAARILANAIEVLSAEVLG